MHRADRSGRTRVSKKGRSAWDGAGPAAGPPLAVADPPAPALAPDRASTSSPASSAAAPSALQQCQPVGCRMAVGEVAVAGLPHHDLQPRVLRAGFEEQAAERPALIHAPVVVEVEPHDLEQVRGAPPLAGAGLPEGYRVRAA